MQHIHNPHSYVITFLIRSLYKKKTTAPLYSSTDVQYDEYTTEEFTSEEYTTEEFTEPPCDEHLLAKERERVLLTVINRQMDQLPARQRQIIYQKFYLGLSYEEISKANNISVNTVYNTVYTAMDKLRILIPRNTVISLVSAIVMLSTIIFCN